MNRSNSFFINTHSSIIKLNKAALLRRPHDVSINCLVNQNGEAWHNFIPVGAREALVYEICVMRLHD